MIKFLIAIIAISAAYLGLMALSKYDATISFLLFNYKIDMSFFLVIVSLILLISISFIAFRLIGMIIQAPYLIAEKLSGYKKNNYIKLLLEAYANTLMGRTDIAQKTISKLNNNKENKDFLEHINLISALSNKDFDKHMYLLQNLLSNQQYHNFAAKILAQNLFDQGFYAQSLQYAEQLRFETNNDPEVLYLMISLYAHLSKWEKFTILMERYIGIFPSRAESIKDKIASYYILGAKYFLSSGEEKQAAFFLEKALAHNPMNMESIEMLCNLNVTLGNARNNLTILESAFEASPSFEIFELYYKSSNMGGIELYNKFTNLADIRAYKDVFLAIAAYLKLFDKIEHLLQSEI